MYAYEQLLSEHNLNVSELPDDVQIAIDGLKQIEKAQKIHSNKVKKDGNPRTISDKVKKKIVQMDKWACSGILDYLEGKEIKNDAPHDVDIILEEITDADTSNVKNSKPITSYSDDKELGSIIDSELGNIISNGKNSMSFDELKNIAPNSYKLIFDTYEEGEPNGIETSYYKIIETDKEFFKITKK